MEITESCLSLKLTNPFQSLVMLSNLSQVISRTGHKPEHILNPYFKGIIQSILVDISRLRQALDKPGKIAKSVIRGDNKQG